MRREDVAKGLAEREAPEFTPTSAVTGVPLHERRVGLLSSAGLIHRGDRPFSLGDSDFRVIDATDGGDILMSHISTNFDRSGFVQDLNVVLPIDRLKEKQERGEIGSVAQYHYSFMGASSPDTMQDAADQVAGKLLEDEVDGLILVPV